MTDEQRSEIWDLYHDTRTVSDLARKFSERSDFPEHVELALLEAKKQDTAASSHLDRVTEAIHHLASLDRATIDHAEHHANVLRLFADAARKE